MSYKGFKILVFILAIAIPGLLVAQKEAGITKKIQDQRYVFKVQSVIPMRGGTRQVSPDEYDLHVSPDSIVSYLPYFGRAYAVSLDPSDAGIKFTSTKFDYISTNRKKGGWDISIKTKDQSDTRQMFLTVSPDGTASLQVTSNNRQPISFNGYIR